MTGVRPVRVGGGQPGSRAAGRCGASAAQTAGDAGSGPHVLVDAVDVDAPELSDDDLHHLTRVLRLRAGDSLTVGDGAGAWRLCRFAGVGARSLLEPVGEVVSAPAPSPELAVGFAVLKGGRSETVVQKLTELGIDRIVPFVAERSVVRWDAARAQRLLQRWQRVAAEAVMQSRRLWLPQVSAPERFFELDLSDAVLADPDPAAGALSACQNFVMVGPEGGWSSEEAAAVGRRVCLSSQILRAETAAVAAAALLAARRSGHLPASEPPAG